MLAIGSVFFELLHELNEHTRKEQIEILRVVGTFVLLELEEIVRCIAIPDATEGRQERSVLPERGPVGEAGLSVLSIPRGLPACYLRLGLLLGQFVVHNSMDSLAHC